MSVLNKTFPDKPIHWYFDPVNQSVFPIILSGQTGTTSHKVAHKINRGIDWKSGKPIWEETIIFCPFSKYIFETLEEAIDYLEKNNE